VNQQVGGVRQNAMSELATFWAEWDSRAPGETRDLERARLLAKALGVGAPGRPVLTLVGSKGKGTAATYASAYLAAAGARVITVTSPGLRTDRDRIRVDGRAVGVGDLGRLATRLATARRSLPRYHPGGGYLSAGGMFTVAGMLHANVVDADVIVLEAGIGGASDEVCLFPPTVVGITSVFDEHLGVLGNTLAEVAADKAGVVAEGTRAVVSLPQDAPAEEAITNRVTAVTGGRVPVETIEPSPGGLPGRLPVSGLGQANAVLGCVAARRMLEVIGRPAPLGDRLAAVLSSVTLPGRVSWHAVPGTRSSLFADAAINRRGVAAALTEASRRWSGIDRVLLCLPDHKDVPGVITELADLPVTFVRLTGDARMRFRHPLPPLWEVVDADEVDRAFLAARGRRLVALGTGYFIARVLDVVDADTERIFIPPASPRSP
jgi:dihydrofolate synthase/folylpolyglutamate synthase